MRRFSDFKIFGNYLLERARATLMLTGVITLLPLAAGIAFLPLAAGIAFLPLVGCASSSDIKELSQQNEVQNSRLRALEKSSSAKLGKIHQEINKMLQSVKASEGRVLVMSDKVEKLGEEQKHISDGFEKSDAQVQAMRRHLKKQEAEIKRQLTEGEKELDALRLQMEELEKVFGSAIANLPSKTQADKDFRKGYSQLVGGMMDESAVTFEAFENAYPDDSRVPEVIFRRGQAHFLMRKYDHAIVPFFELLDKHPDHKLVLNAQWMLARGLEETGDLKLAREFYAQLIAQNSIYKADATRRVHFINELYPNLKKENPPAQSEPAEIEPAEPDEEKSKQGKQ